MKRVLLIQYHCLPVNHAGTGHLLGHARFLPLAGWETTVLTGQWDELEQDEKAHGHTWEPETEHTRSRMPPFIRARRRDKPNPKFADTLTEWGFHYLGHILRDDFPDHFSGWAKPALAAALKQHRLTPFDAIVSYCPPETNVMVGSMIARRLNLPFVVCFGDLYTFARGSIEDLRPFLREFRAELRVSFSAFRTRVTTIIDHLVEDYRHRLWMRTAMRCTGVSPYMVALVDEAFGVPGDVLPVGFDDDEFPAEARMSAAPTGNERMVVSHVGSIYPTSAYGEGAQRFYLLLDGIDLFLAARPDAIGNVDFRFIGTRQNDHIESLLKDRPCGAVCRTLPKVNSSRAFAYVRESDALLAFALNWGGEGTLSHPGKISEAFGAGRPIMVIPSDHEWMQHMVDETQGGVTADDGPAVARVLEAWYDEWLRTGRAAAPGREMAIREFGQAALSRKLAVVLDTAVREKAEGRGRRKPRAKSQSGMLVRINLGGHMMPGEETHDVWKITIADARGVERHVVELGRQEIEHVLLGRDRSFVVRCPTPDRNGTWTLTPHIAGHGWQAPVSGPVVPAGAARGAYV